MISRFTIDFDRNGVSVAPNTYVITDPLSCAIFDPYNNTLRYPPSPSAYTVYHPWQNQIHCVLHSPQFNLLHTPCSSSTLSPSLAVFSSYRILPNCCMCTPSTPLSIVSLYPHSVIIYIFNSWTNVYRGPSIDSLFLLRLANIHRLYRFVFSRLTKRNSITLTNNAMKALKALL